MKNFYDILGVFLNASQRAIKKAYVKLALTTHPDKLAALMEALTGEEIELLNEKIRLINEAYETLSDPEKRRNYDANLRAFQEADVDNEVPFSPDGLISSGDLLPFSHAFRVEHKALEKHYATHDVGKRSPRESISLPGIYFIQTNYGTVSCNTIFCFLKQIGRYPANPLSQSLPIPQEPLTPVLAITLLTNFLHGRYFGAALPEITEYFTKQLSEARKHNVPARELQLMEGIFELIAMTEKEDFEHRKLIFSINKITHFVKQAPEALMPHILPLFYNKYFRSLYAYALQLYWHNREDLFASNESDGQQEARALLNELKERLSHSTEQDKSNIFQLIKYVKLLFNFEKDLSKPHAMDKNEGAYRESAFHLIDWIPAFLETSSKAVLVNVFLHIGMKFQHSSKQEFWNERKIADEKLALKMYLTAVEIARHTTPDLEMYVTNHVLKYLNAFEFEEEILSEASLALEKRALMLADVFPFFERIQSNIAFLQQETQMLGVLRQLLNAMVDIYGHNKTHIEPVRIDHCASTILYHAFEACLKNWYREEHDPDLEYTMRLNLMDELLVEKNWSPVDVEKNMDSEWIRVDRDEQGWLKPVATIPFAEATGTLPFRTINGVEINQKTGEIQFLMNQWTPDYPEYEKLFTLFDLQEMLEKNLSAAIFSLDPVDATRPYHPFNAMRFSPAQLCGTELLNTMLLTDYMLKFLTTNQEVQGHYPFDQQPVSSMLAHLPEYLLKIITDFHAAEHVASLHRFWIEAGEIDISISDAVSEEGIVRIGLGNIKMTVKKHRMERDMHGELRDVGNEKEGWPIYVLQRKELDELVAGFRRIDGQAMLFIYAETRLFYWENNTITHRHAIENYRETLIRLFKQPKDLNGQVLQNSANQPLLVRITREMARQTGMPHCYSPEFIFAHEFTTHYEEFAHYLPEFGRLKELSKMTALIRVLESRRKGNQEALDALNVLLGTSIPGYTYNTKAYKHYYARCQETTGRVVSIFQEWRRELASSVLFRKWAYKLQQIRDEMGDLSFTRYSSEVNNACQNWHDKIASDNPRIESSRIWTEVVNPKRDDIAKELTESKTKACRESLHKTFSQWVLHATNPMNTQDNLNWDNLIDSFLQGNSAPLVQALLHHEQGKALQQIQSQFPYSSTEEMACAINDHGENAALGIAMKKSQQQLQQEKLPREKLESGFCQIKLGKEEQCVDLTGQCFWVPASINHTVRKESKAGRYGFFEAVYGGVSVQPQINIVSGGNTSSSNSSVNGSGLNNINAKVALNTKLKALEVAQNVAVRSEQFMDGRVRYYSRERLANTPGPTRGNAHVTEYNPRTGQVRAWAESYDHKGNVNRVHPKMVNGQKVYSSHYPPTGAELNKARGGNR
ncbi:MAG: J domain-containing protein [Tatlockia sp.]|jgi:hypothetical protein